MFERFTEKAIKVILLAQEEVRRLGHNFVGTEQILLGLIGEGTGVAAKVLKSMGVNLKDARVEVEKIIGRGSGFVAVEIPFTPRAKRVLELSLEEARQLGHNFVGTEHLLLGLIREEEGVAARVLENLGVDLSKVRTQVIRMGFWNQGANPAEDPPEENIDNSSTQVDTQNWSPNETQIYHEIYERVYKDIYNKFSGKFKDIELTITQENRKINDRIAGLELEIHNRKTKDTKVREQKEPTGIPTLKPSEPPASQTYQSTSPSVSSSSSSSIEVSPTEESLANRLRGNSEPIVLENKRRGHYEVYFDGNYHCLVPSQNFRINQNNYQIVKTLFECRNYDPNFSDGHILIHHAVVYPLADGKTWQLQLRGILEF